MRFLFGRLTKFAIMNQMHRSLFKKWAAHGLRYDGKPAAQSCNKYRQFASPKSLRPRRAISSTPIHHNLVPVVVEESGQGERAFDIYSRLLRERIICVHGAVTDAMSSVVTAQLLFLESEAPEKPVYIYINSPGGVVRVVAPSTIRTCVQLSLLSAVLTVR